MTYQAVIQVVALATSIGEPGTDLRLAIERPVETRAECVANIQVGRALFGARFATRGWCIDPADTWVPVPGPIAPRSGAGR